MKKAKEYKRLPGRSRSISGQSSLWQGGDHLLAVDRVYFEERYRRFHFGDFQAFVVQTTSRWHLTTLVLSLLTLILITPGWLLWQDNEFELALMALLPSALCLTGLVVNLMKGKSCRCFLQMRVGVHDLPSIRRRRQAEKILERIKPLIGNAQKDVQVSAEQVPAPDRKVFRSSRSEEKGVRPYSGTWHFVLYAVLMLDVVLTSTHLFTSGMTLFILNNFVGIALMLISVFALVAQRNTALPASTRTSTWGILALYFVASTIGGFYYVFFFLTKQPELLISKPAMYQAMADLKVVEHPFLLVFLNVCIGVSLICVAFGLFGIVQMRRREKAGETP